MTHKTILRRETDGKLFKVVYLAHWSEIRSDDGEVYSVKWLGGDEYVGVSGPTFTVVKEER